MMTQYPQYPLVRCPMCGLPLGENEGQLIDGKGRVCAYGDCIAMARGQKPVVQSGDKVFFWVPQTGTVAQRGIVEQSENVCGSTYAKIIPDTPPYTPKYLFYRAVWGFEPVRGE